MEPESRPPARSLSAMPQLALLQYQPRRLKGHQDRSSDFVVLNMWFHFDQVLGIEVVIPRLIVVFAGEALNRIEVVPKSQVQEMRHISVATMQAPCTAIARSRGVVANGKLLHELQILGALRGWDDSVPDSGNHQFLPVPGLCFAIRRIASRLRATSDSVVAHEDTLMRIAFLPFQTVPPHQHVPSS